MLRYEKIIKGNSWYSFISLINTIFWPRMSQNRLHDLVCFIWEALVTELFRPKKIYWWNVKGFPKELMPNYVRYNFWASYLSVKRWHLWALPKSFGSPPDTLFSSVTVASAERSFSNLKLIKSYLRKERLSGLAIISINNKIGHQVTYSEVIADFASRKARRDIFK